MLNKLQKTTTGRNKRVGRGYGSGKGGHTSSRGTKGQRSRVGQTVPLWFEGGQLPLIRRLPYIRGKDRNTSLQTKPELVQLSVLEKKGLETINLEVLKAHKLIRRNTASVKIVGAAKLSRAMTIEGVRTSKSVQARIVKAGGKVIGRE